MSMPDENTVMGWTEHDAHADDARDVDAEQDPPEEGWVYVYARQVPRTVLSESMYEHVLDSARRGASITGGMDALTMDTIVQTTLAAVGFLTPPPEVLPEERGEFCAAMWPNEAGWWLQCSVAPDVPHAEHRRGDEVWADIDANAIPAPVYSTEPPF
ncbi:hypothetical protein ACFQ6C_25845 [Streptomyces sp. NPDC056454]|uniref:hypothetical protein n=1 Tax=Streptomyces sp. NPDC056454 TaxID=3345823 RepID=UPI0036CA822F